jgi:hypothetical protein
VTQTNDSSPSGRRPRTTAGRLLLAVEATGSTTLEELARHLGLPVRWLEECRDGKRTLEIEAQILLSALVLMLVPELAAQARHLHGQAQSALRVRNGAVESHMTYYSPHRWFNG